MFCWHKEITCLDIPASQVFHLERSLSAVQVALPGLPSQEATAYLCVFSAEKGLRAALVLHLHTSQCLAFYLHEGVDAPQKEAVRLIEEGLDFAESLGFMLSDVDYRKLDKQQRVFIWDSLPLKNGVEPSVMVAEDALAAAAENSPGTPFARPSEKTTAGDVSRYAPSPPSFFAEKAIVELPDEILAAPLAPVQTDDQLAQEAKPLPAASSETMHETLTDRVPTLRASVPKHPPRAEDLTVRRQKFLESLGRFLASL
jgi:hypothetical protein